ncbi:MAG: hypothetical protein RMJ36_03185 [Candidatus Calescibacterium sp.]|nr:hypothetical protein [Candidatus Calescibacterium sp.]MDW8132640.1 hypothetical protein [Candidatus Calescibacterium sp.]
MYENIIEYEIRPIKNKIYLFLIVIIFLYIISFFIFFSYFTKIDIDSKVHIILIGFSIITIWGLSEDINRIFSRRIKSIIYRILSSSELKLELVKKIDSKLDNIMNTQIQTYKEIANVPNLIIEYKEVIKIVYDYETRYIFLISVLKNKNDKNYLIISYNPEKLVSSLPNEFQIFHTDEYSIIITDKTMDLTIWTKKEDIKKVIQNISTVINYVSSIHK